MMPSIPVDPIVLVSRSSRAKKVDRRTKNTTRVNQPIQETSFDETTVSPEGPSSKAQPPCLVFPVADSRYAFIDDSNPETKDREVLRLMRSHVQMNSARNRKKRKSEVFKELVTHPRLNKTENKVLQVGNLSFLSSEPQSALYASLVEQIVGLGSTIHPIDVYWSYTPLRTVEYLAQMSDYLLYHAGLYMITTYLSLGQENADSREPAKFMSRAIRLLNERLEKLTTDISDSTISSIACLAMAGAVTGNNDQWDIHMVGVQRMIELRGGCEKLSIGLQMKISCCDVMGAVNFLSKPKIPDLMSLSSKGAIPPLFFMINNRPPAVDETAKNFTIPWLIKVVSILYPSLNARTLFNRISCTTKVQLPIMIKELSKLGTKSVGLSTFEKCFETFSFPSRTSAACPGT